MGRRRKEQDKVNTNERMREQKAEEQGGNKTKNAEGRTQWTTWRTGRHAKKRTHQQQHGNGATQLVGEETHQNTKRRQRA